MSKLTNYHKNLIDKTVAKLSTSQYKRLYHIESQVHTHIDLLQRKGIGSQVLEHYLKAKSVNDLHSVFYFNGQVWDFTKLKRTYWFKSVKDCRWKETKKAPCKRWLAK